MQQGIGATARSPIEETVSVYYKEQVARHLYNREITRTQQREKIWKPGSTWTSLCNTLRNTNWTNGLDGKSNTVKHIWCRPIQWNMISKDNSMNYLHREWYDIVSTKSNWKHEKLNPIEERTLRSKWIVDWIVTVKLYVYIFQWHRQHNINSYISILYIKETTNFSTLLGWNFLSKNTLNFKYK